MHVWVSVAGEAIDVLPSAVRQSVRQSMTELCRWIVNCETSLSEKKRLTINYEVLWLHI